MDLAAHGLLSPPARLPIPGAGPQRLADLLDGPVARTPEREALVGRHGRYDYGALDAAVDRAAHALVDAGLKPGDRVAACLPNDCDIVIAFLATARAGGIWVGVNAPLAAPEKAYLLRDSGARLYLTTPDGADEIEAERASLPELNAVVRVAPDKPDADWSRALARASGEPFERVSRDPFEPAAIAYTSGTTGFPKGAVHSDHNLLLVGAVMVANGRFGPDVRQGVVLPLTILNLMVLSPLVAFQDGSCCVCMDQLWATGIAETVRRERIGHFAGVPTILHDLLTHPDVRPEDLASLISPEIGGADVPSEFAALYRERFGRHVTIGYGMTEAPTAVTRTDGRSAPGPGLCGHALDQLEIEIRDEQGRVLPPGETGEICVRPRREGPWAGVYTPMLGYWNQPDASREALRDGVYHSGDLGELDADGALWIRGRRNELILRGGANVYPAEVERALAGCAGVQAAAVLGLPDPRLGERVAAAIVPEPGAEPDPDSLRAELSGRIARYKVPERFAFVDALPRNAMGKVIKRELLPAFRETGA